MQYGGRAPFNMDQGRTGAPMGGAPMGGGGPVGGGGMGMPMGGAKGGGPMPMPGGMGGGQGGGGQPPPGQSYTPSPGQMIPAPAWGTPHSQYQAPGDQGRQAAVDDAAMALQQAQFQGGDPMTIARLQQAWMQAQRGLEQWQTQTYAEEMGRLGRRSPTIGGGQSQSQLEQNPYLAMLMQSQIGMGGGGGGSSSGGLNSIGRG